VTEVARLRSFHRAVTERVGALEVEYLGRRRPLGESRLLWEVGDEGAEVRDLRGRLGLDSGYVSRLLRSLEEQGLVAVEESRADRRVRVARLTARGRRERSQLDRLSDDLVSSILDPLDTRQRTTLVEAAATVERLLRASLVTVAVEDPRSEDARRCIGAYFAELAGRFEAGFDPELSLPADEDDLTPPRGLLLVARLREQPVGCGALKHHPGAATELKRMWVHTDVRGLGVGRRLLRELEDRAAAAGAPAVRLETNGTLVEAIRLYRAAGYREVPAFNDEPYAHHWFEKALTPSSTKARRRPRAS
jgi:DNA-binding MarR family transcriptional regulator/ribosomal protein S18 acetylase RimI-like enzyme